MENAEAILDELEKKKGRILELEKCVLLLN